MSKKIFPQMEKTK